MINSRLRESSNLFDCYFEIELDKTNNPCVRFKYPDDYKDEEVIRSVPSFCFPYSDIEFSTISHFSFVLTGQDSKWSYGFCRHLAGKSKRALVLMSSYCWSQTFFKLLNYISDIKTKYDERHFQIFLESLFKAENKTTSTIAMSYIYYVDNNLFSYKIQMNDTNTNRRLPCIPDDRNLTEFFNAIEPTNMIKLFASILNERRIIIHSTRLARLSACVQASNLIIFPLQWENVFIPILPEQFENFVHCPTPYIIGLHKSVFDKINLPELGDVVVLDADKNVMESTHNDSLMIPYDVVAYLKKGLKKTQQLFGDGLSRLFLRAIIMMIGGYRQALVFNRFTPGQKITFNDKAFVESRPLSMQPFLEKMLHLQLFRQFIENRLDKLNSGLSCDDCFDLEMNNYSLEDYKKSKKFKAQYHEWLSTMKKEGGNLMNKTISPIKSINQPVRSVYKNIKDKSRKTYKEFVVKINDNLNKKANNMTHTNHIYSSNLDLSSSLYRPMPRMSNDFSKFYHET